MNYTYNRAFYDYIQAGALSSARVLLPIVKGILKTASVLDVGCGAGAWLKIWAEIGLEDYRGVDGEYVDRSQLLIADERYIAADITSPFDLKKSFDLVQSLEVGEHISESTSHIFVQNLCAHSDLVLFSAAPPGQGGENHINEKPYSFWRRLFNRHNFDMYDPFRELIKNNRKVEPWYRYNVFLYAKRSVHQDLPPAVRNTRLQQHNPKDISPPLYRIRKSVFRFLPVKAASAMAVLKKHALNNLRRVFPPR